MQTDLLALAGFALAASITPGPNNLMLMASGANHGIVRSLPLWCGIWSGFVLLIVVVGLGAGALILENPPVRAGFRVACALVILWLGWKIATARRAGTGPDAPRPLGYVQAAAFQWINPKGWTMALAAISLYAPGTRLLDILLVAGIFALVNIPSTAVWLVTGERVQRALRREVHFRLFNIAMAALLVGSVMPMLLGER